MSGSKLQDQALTLKICALSASYLTYIAIELINKHSASYIYPPKLRDHAPLAFKRLNYLPWFMLLNKIVSYEMEMFSSFLKKKKKIAAGKIYRTEVKSLTQFCPAGVSLNAFPNYRGRGGVPSTVIFR